MEDFNYSDELEYNVNPFLPKNLRLISSVQGYSVYFNDKTKQHSVDIIGKKNPQPKSFFCHVDSIDEAIELIELISNPVRD